MKITLLEKFSKVAPEGFTVDVEKETVKNTDYRRVLFTTKNTQLVLMNLKPGEEIGEEMHKDGSQFFRFEAGTGQVIMGDKEVNVKDGDVVIVPQGLNHNVINTSNSKELKVYALYSPPQHKDGTVHKTKDDEK